MQWGRTALMWAARRDHTATCNALIDAGVDVHAISTVRTHRNASAAHLTSAVQYGRTAAAWTAQKGRSETSNALRAAAMSDLVAAITSQRMCVHGLATGREPHSPSAEACDWMACSAKAYLPVVLSYLCA